ncbi:phenoloxidase-activating factor 1-like isoform X2 [Bradysia coprophila]|uniref:phenoloxidase-activating factor 1-like isoform X2 n=1 Tax=Bradysia coprophila TaxID=38358 RepID=UPI00187DABD0|nr:phenoloxidase-activating factor 1-like isoform X2 [Bradysia coprophila]
MVNSHKCIVFLSFGIWSAQAIYLPPWQSGEDGRIKWAHNCDFNGNYLGKVRSNGEECGGLCFQKPECTRFLWTYENRGTCHFKSGNEKAFFAENGGICGYVAVEKVIVDGISWVMADAHRIRWAANCDFTGLNIEERKIPGEMCGSQCLSRLDCIGFVWTNYEGGTCWLKSRGHPILAYTGTGGVCGEIIGRKASYGSSTQSSDYKRKSELACNEYTDIASHYRIRIGESSQRNEFPWMAALGYRLSGSIEFRCGGTIISDYYILTAAHCVDPEPEIVQLGTHILNDAKKTNMLVESCQKHEHFSFEARKNDIALIKLEKRITFSNRILPACLRTSSNDLPWNQELIVTGWGITEDGNLSDVLKKASLRTTQLSSCQADYLKEGPEPKNHISDSQYCAIDPDGIRDACQGDSGGPIQLLDNSPLATVVGVTSFGKGCPSKLPGVYSRVSSYVDWIEAKVWDD